MSPPPAVRPNVRARVTRVYERNRAARRRIVANEGGARSSKSHSIAQLLIERFCNQTRKRILVTRKTGPALNRTAYRLVLDLLKDYGIYPYLRHNKTHSTVLNPHTLSEFEFYSLDDTEKIKSTEYNYVWMEEGAEFTWDDFLVIQTRLSAATLPHEPNQIFISYNPTDEHGWIKTRLLDGRAFKDRVDYIHSTYEDNPFLDDDYRLDLENLKGQDLNSWLIFAKGRYGQLTNIVYPAYQMVESWPAALDEVIYGIDFGYNNPSAVLRIGLSDGRNAYLEQRVYERRLTNPMLIERMKAEIPEEDRGLPFYADAAEPDRIDELESAGFNVYPAEKDVKAGIDFCKRFKFYALPGNEDLKKERAAYKWRTDRNGNVLDEPVKFMDHLMDCKRYALYTHHKEQGREPKITVI